MSVPRRLGRVAGLAVAFAVIAFGCGTSAGTGGPPPSAPEGGAVITADHITFDRAELVLPADRAFPLIFENRESAPHNVTVFNEASGQVLFAGEIFGGPGSRTYAVPPIPAGTHRFRCDVHPEMAGAVIAEST
jgi:plastocyanin